MNRRAHTISCSTTALMLAAGCIGLPTTPSFDPPVANNGTTGFPDDPVSVTEDDEPVLEPEPDPEPPIDRPPPDGSSPLPQTLHSWTFNNGDEGWTLLGGDFVDYTRPGWSLGGRKLAGEGGGTWYFVAPESLSGDRLDIYGARLRFNLSRDTSCQDSPPDAWQGIVVLSDGAWSIGWGYESGFQKDYSGQLSVRLDESEEWFVVSSADSAVPVGSRASAGIFESVLANLTELKIFGQRENCRGLTTLDTVRIGN